MPTIDFYSRQEVDTLLANQNAQFMGLLKAYVTDDEEWLPTCQALRKAGIPTRDSLEKYARASRPGVQEKGRISWKKQGVKNVYLKSSCIDYAQRKLGQPALRA